MNIARPSRVVWLGEEPQSAILQRLAAIDCTMISYGNLQPRGDWDAIFYPSSMDSQRVEETLLTRMGSAKLGALNLKSVMPELRSARAGLVWSNIGESDKTGAVYWYDISEGEAPPDPLTGSELALTLRDLADRISSAK